MVARFRGRYANSGEAQMVGLRILRLVGIVAIMAGMGSVSAVELQPTSIQREPEATIGQREGVYIHYGSDSLGQSVGRLLTDCGANRPIHLLRVTVQDGTLQGHALPPVTVCEHHTNWLVVLFFDPESEDELQVLWRERLTNQGVRAVPVLFERSRTNALDRERMLSVLHQALVECLPQERNTLRRNLQRELHAPSTSVITVVASDSFEP